MDYSILRYGAVADGVTNCAAAIQQAVDAAAAAGGGRVIVPAGRFLSGSVLLKDNVELHLESGAVLISSLNPADITPFPQGGDGTDPDDTADGWEGTLAENCPEGDLAWVKKEKVPALPLWEGDRIFLRLLEEAHPFFSLKLVYEGDHLIRAVLDGKELPR